MLHSKPSFTSRTSSLEALELRDRGLVDHGAVANHTNLAVAADCPARDVGAGDRSQAGDAEELAHLGLAERLFRGDRGEHADERLLDVLGQAVDDAVGADLDVLALRERTRLGVRTHVEADNESVRGRGARGSRRPR